jgi:CRISPR/Cas system-associated endonuclease/helicase Cas3
VNTLYTDTDINEYFRALTGFQPRQFQTEIIHKILNRQDFLLRAPTGSGKTETADAPFLFCVSGMDLFGGRFGNSLPSKFSIAQIGKIVRYNQLFWQAGLFFSVFARSNSNHSRTPVVAEFES